MCNKNRTISEVKKGLAMKKLHLSGRVIWLGQHPKVGFFVYDKTQQNGIVGDVVRVFIIARKAMAIFPKDIIEIGATKIIDTDKLEIALIIWDYFDFFQTKSRTKAETNIIIKNNICMRCQAPVSKSGILQCAKCGWVKVECGACAGKRKSFCNCPKIFRQKLRTVKGKAFEINAS
jgi:hypothetical protein